MISTSSLGLGWLLAPLSAEAFFEDRVGRTPRRLERDDEHYFDVLPSLKDVDGLITSTMSVPKPEHGRLVRTGPDGAFSELPFAVRDDGHVDVQAIYRSYSKGYSVVLNLVEQRSPVVASLCRAMARDLESWVGANYYLTPAGAQGFAAHYDSHDVLIAQISGSKSWRVGRAPYVDIDEPGLARPGFETESQVWDMKPGDVAYLPKGTAHQAVTGAHSSVHVTFGIEPWPNRDGADAELLSAYQSRYMARSGHFVALDSALALSPESLIVRAIPGPILIRDLVDIVRLEFPGGTVEMPARYREAITFVVNNDTFRVNDVPSSAGVKAVELVRQLIASGALGVHP